MLLIDVAFVQARPSPWRQAVDLANMMLSWPCASIRSWSTSGPAPVQRRGDHRGLRGRPRAGAAVAAAPDAGPRAATHAEFIRLLPTAPAGVDPALERPPGRASALVLLWWCSSAGLLANNVSNAMALETPLDIDNLACTDLEPLWLQAQAVPSASQVPCIRDLPVGWTLGEVAVNDGRSVLTLNHDRAGVAALVGRGLTAGCDPGGAVEGPSQTTGVRHYQQIESRTGQFTLTWYDQFPGGCRHQPVASDDRP